MLGGKRPALINARLAAHQAWYFATVGRNDLARAVALDALSLARKVPCNANTEVIDDGTNLRAQVQKLLDSLGGGGGMRFKSDWHFARRPFLVQAASAALLIGGAWYWINYAYEP